MSELLLLGALAGVLLSLIAIGFSLIYGVLRLIDFSHMDRLTVAAYSFLLLERHLGLVLAAAGAIFVAAMMAVVTEFAVYRRIRNRGTTSIMIASLGISVITQAILAISFGSGLKVPIYEEHAFDLWGFHLFPHEIVLICIFPFILLGLWLVLFHTGFGITLRAIAADYNRSVLFRVPTGSIVSAMFALAGSLAGLAGVFVVISSGIYPYVGLKYMIMAFAVCIVAGFGNLIGTAVAGIFLGILLTLAEAYGSSLASEGIALLVFCLVLLFRPSGLLPKRIQWTIQ